MRAALACLALGSLAACGGKGAGGGAAKPKAPVGPAIDAKQAEQGASDLVTEIYETLGRGSKDSLFTLLDDSLIVFGPRSSDMLGTRADALVALDQVVDPKAKKKLAIQSGQLEIVPAPGGHSAVAVDTASFNGQSHTVMAVLTNTNDLWLVDAVAVAHTPAAPELKAELAKDAVVPPGAAGRKKIDPAAKAAVEKFQKGLLDQAMWGDELASHAGAIVVGPMAGEVTRGKADIKALWKKRVEAKTRAAVSGEITAAVTNDGQLAWVSAPITRVEGEGTQPLPLRAFAVYEQTGGEWTLLALDESLAFGAPGAGVSFKKILPPKPVEPKPAEPKPGEPKPGEPKPTEVVAAKPKEPKEKEPPPPAKKAKPAAEEPDKKKVAKKPAKAEEPVEEAPKKVAKKPAKAEEPAEEAPKKKVAKKPAKAEEPVEEAPKKKVAKKPAKAKENEEEDEAPKKKKRTFADLSEDGAAGGDEEETPKKPAKKPAKAAKEKEKEKDEEEEAPKKPAKKPAKVAKEKAEEPAEEAPKKPAKKPAKVAKEKDEEEAPKKPAKKPAKATDEAPKKKKPAAEEDDDVVEVSD